MAGARPRSDLHAEGLLGSRPEHPPRRVGHPHQKGSLVGHHRWHEPLLSEQFPSMDLALTFHIGLILRIPRTEEQQKSDLRILPFGPVFEKMEEAGTAVTQAQNLADYQAVGVRCREALLELIGVAQDAATWTDAPPQRANFRAWTEIICNDLVPGDTNKERR